MKHFNLLILFKIQYPVICKSKMPAFEGGRAVLMATTVFYQPFGHLEEVPKIKERKVVGYKCKFCVEVHPTLRAICNHLRKHVQYGSVPAVSAAVKVRRGRSRHLVCVCVCVHVPAYACLVSVILKCYEMSKLQVRFCFVFSETF